MRLQNFNEGGGAFVIPYTLFVAALSVQCNLTA